MQILDVDNNVFDLMVLRAHCMYYPKPNGKDLGFEGMGWV